ncbi:MAG: trehalase family glycosidase [Candidatus Saccharimonadales bacterium]
MSENQPDLFQQAKHVLETNNQGNYTVPAAGMYPHQWLWDSCFIAIGQRHYDIDRAKQEILSLTRGQWANGMMPNMILKKQGGRVKHGNIWRSWLNPNAPDGLVTSGITQPPMLAEAVVKIGKKLNKTERYNWYRTMYPVILSYHQWLYNDRDPHNEGLVLQIHPWETGLDNTPPWISLLLDHRLPLWINAVDKLKLEPLINLLRRDTKFVHQSERLSTIEALTLFSVQRRLRRKNYDTTRILSHSLFAIEDATFNAIFIRANEHLYTIAKTLRKVLPDDLEEKIERSKTAYDQLWDQYSNQYYSREFVTHKLIKIPSIATLMPLYSGVISKERAEKLVKLILDEHQFGTNYPVPTVPLSSEWFKARTYWQGPTWINTNWLIIDGLERYGYREYAEAIRESTIEMVEKSGFYEYFSPIDGSPAGIADFSWSAALIIDMLNN